MSLTGKQRRHLRALGHPLTPVVQVGREGASEPLVAAVDEALTTHELIKIKIGQNAAVDRHQLAEQLAQATGSEVAQILGNTMLLFRAHPDKPIIVLPKASRAG